MIRLACLFALILAACTPAQLAQCETDSECFERCPPMDCDCDGGPQS